MVNVSVDVMGGDNAPVEPVKGAVNAVLQNNEIKVYLCGKKDVVEKELKKYKYPADRIEIVDAPEVIEMGEPPVMAIRKKKESSIVKGLNLVKEGVCDAFVSAGSSGAILVGGQVIVGRIKGVERPPLAPVFPTDRGISILIDCGANVDARASHLVQFAKMGTIYMEHVLGVHNPKVGILNIGTEEEKGNMLVKEAYPLLKNCPDINFIGSVEAREIPRGTADIVVCEAFAGNVALKMYEGVGKSMIGALKETFSSSLATKLAYLLVKPALKKTLKRFDATEYGGAPLLGLKGLVVKTHGNATHKEISTSILQCVTFKKQEISRKINETINMLDEGA
ncbi:MAG: phosphate acyltransferase PlsX [Lachnospiraceae bacterium]|nr:phosphate acyltransferase PlsX [Lachnospiraceae bacterium]